jgi:transposase
VEVHRALKSAGQGQGHRYSLGQWEKREGYIESGHLQVDNKRAERAIKPFVIGRKNWMFAITANAATRARVLYSPGRNRQGERSHAI